MNKRFGSTVHPVGPTGQPKAGQAVTLSSRSNRLHSGAGQANSLTAQNQPAASPARLAPAESLRGISSAAPLRAAFESHYGHDFGRVQVHTSGPASRLAQSLGAEALAFGHSIAFRPGAFQPETPAGARLLAHELAHVAQQSGLEGQAGQVSHRSGSYQRLEEQAEAVGQATERPRDSAAPAPDRSAQTRPMLRLPAAPAPQLQLYSVPGSLRCDEVVDWLNSNSPYAPEWAETRSTYAFNGSAITSSRSLPDGTVEIHVRGHRGMGVSVNSPIDMPAWNPGPRTNRQAEVGAWSAMIGVLSTHEHTHRQIAATWRATLESNWRGLDFTVSGADTGDARQNAVNELESQKNTWGQQAQDAQDAIDPFRGAVLNCPSAPTAPQQENQENTP